MAKKSNQHYVPQFYFRFFSQDGKSISVLNRRTGSTIEKAPIKGQASKNYFYGDVEVEDALSEIEDHFSAALRQIKNEASFEKCSPEHYVLFIQSIMLQKSRTMSARKKSKEGADRFRQLYMEVEVNNDDSLDDETKKGFLEIVKNLESDPKQYQKMAMSTAVQCAEYLFDLLPIVLHNKTNRPFIFGDAPVIFTNPHLKNITSRGALGAQTPGLLIYYPIDSEYSVMLVDEKKYRIKGFRKSIVSVRNLSDIAALNKLQIHNATSAVYFSDYKYSGYVSQLWRQEKNRLRDHKDSFAEVPGFDHNGQPLGYIFHSFEPQLPFIPKLSFLRYGEISEEDYTFSRREE